MALAGLNKYVNFYRATLTEDVDPAHLQIQVLDTTGLPTVTDGEYFYLSLLDIFSPLTTEIVKCTRVSGTTLNVVRGQDGTVARAFDAGDMVNGNFVAGILTDLQDDWDVAEAGLSALISANDATNILQDGEIAVLTIVVDDNTALVASNAAALAVEEARIDNLQLVELADITSDGADAFYDVQTGGVSTADPIATLSDIARLSPGGLFAKFEILAGTGFKTFSFNIPFKAWYRFVINGQQGCTRDFLNSADYSTDIRVFTLQTEKYHTEYRRSNNPLTGSGNLGLWNAQMIFEVELEAGPGSIILQLFSKTAGVIPEWNPSSAPGSRSYIMMFAAEVV